MGFDQSFRFRDCPWCGLHDAQMNALSVNQRTTGDGSRPGTTRHRCWTMLSCPRCANVTLLETNPENENPGQIVQVIPRPNEDVIVAHLPEDVHKYYLDSLRVLDAGVPDASAVQLRRTLEAAAAHFEIRQGPLVNRIRGLIKAGLVTSQFGDVLDHVRVIGNIGAHASDELLDEDRVRRALRFTTQMLRNLFEIPAELAEIQGQGEQEAEEPEHQS